jgi:hypothetical protein
LLASLKISACLKKPTLRPSSSVPPADRHTYRTKTQSEASLPFVAAIAANNLVFGVG